MIEQMEERETAGREGEVEKVERGGLGCRCSGLIDIVLVDLLLLLEPVETRRRTPPPANRDVPNVPILPHLSICLLRRLKRRLRDPLEPLAGGSEEDAVFACVEGRAADVGEGVEGLG